MKIQNRPVQRLGIQPVKPDARMVAESITIPRIFHSDGKLDAVLDDLVDLGIAGLHPVEPGAMDIRV